MAVVKLGGGTVKVQYVTDLTGADNKLIKRNVKGTLVMNLSDIMAVDVYYNTKAQLDPAKCRIFHEQLGWMTLNESFEEISHLKMDGTVQVKGFQQRHYGKVKMCKTNKTNKHNKVNHGNTRNPRKNA